MLSSAQKPGDNLEISELNDMQMGIVYESLKNEYTHPIYVVQMLLSIQGSLDVALLNKAFNVLAERHKNIFSMSVVYDKEKVKYTKRINPFVPVDFHEYNLMNFSAEEKNNKFNKFLNNDFTQPIELNQSPLMRIAVFLFSPDSFKIVWTRHHVLLDHNSVQLLIYEWFAIYFNYLTDKKYTYLAYNEKKANVVKIADVAAKDYWRDVLGFYRSSGFLPAKTREMPQKQIKIISGVIRKEISSQLADYILKYDLTANTIIEAVWSIVLSRYSNNNRIIFGSVRAFPGKSIKNNLGLFVTTLPVSFEINNSQEIIDFLKNHRSSNSNLKKFITTPVNKIKQWCEINPEEFLYQSIIDYKPNSTGDMLNNHFKPLKFTVDINLNIPYPLMLEFKKEKNRLIFKVHYESGIFDDNFIKSIMDYYQLIFEAIVFEKYCHIGDLPTLLPEQLAKILQWNKTAIPEYKDKNVILELKKQVAKNKDLSALVYEDMNITYGKLDSKTNQLANILLPKNIRSRVVGIFLDSPLETIISLIAILKAGGVYLIIDPTLPLQRIQKIIDDSNIGLIISERSHVNVVEGFSFKRKSIIIFEEIDWIGTKKSYPKITLAPDDPMYLIYTSGSTGRPKGVVVKHSAAVNMAYSCISELNITKNSRILQISSVNFDVFVAEWCMALLSGASLYLFDKKYFSPNEIYSQLKDHKITAIILASSILSALPKASLPSLKTIAMGGERCNDDVILFWRKRRNIYNIYGVTEAAVCSTVYKYSAVIKSSVIGRPIANTRMFILDENEKVLPLEVPGELCISGASLPGQYLNSALLDNKNFVTKKIIDDKKISFYKTGDIARWNSKGLLEYIGRKDDQIKIAGARIEIGEIEAVINKIPGIEKGIVVSEISPTGLMLMAYIILKNKLLTIFDIKKTLKMQLPSFMIPARFFMVNNFPLTVNGKVDRAKLSLMTDIHEMEYAISNNFSVIENKICKVIEKILNIKQAAVNINFLDLGFNSFTLLGFASELNSLLQKKVSIMDIFQYTTVESLAKYLSQK